MLCSSRALAVVARNMVEATLRQLSVGCFSMALILSLVSGFQGMQECLVVMAITIVLLSATLSHSLLPEHAEPWGSLVGMLIIVGFSGIYMGLYERTAQLVSLIVFCAIFSFTGMVLVTLAGRFSNIKGVSHKNENEFY